MPLPSSRSVLILSSLSMAELALVYSVSSLTSLPMEPLPVAIAPVMVCRSVAICVDLLAELGIVDQLARGALFAS